MLRLNFLYKFFKHPPNRNHEIIKYNSKREFDIENEINVEIVEIEQRISENSRALLEAQIVKLRSTLAKSNNFIEKIGKNVYKVKLEESINWHQQQLKDLYLKRRDLKTKLEKIQGVFWFNRLKRFLKIICIGLLILLSLFIFLSGFMILIYLLPVILFILIGYLIINK